MGIESSIAEHGCQKLSALRRKFPISATVGVVGTIIGVLGGGVGLLDAFSANATTREWVLSITLGATTVYALVALARREKELGRHSRYVATLHQQEKATELLRDLRIYLRRFGEGTSLETPTPEVLARTRNMIGEF
jgi:hypothetical protein